jgi:hypothetical protein
VYASPPAVTIAGPTLRVVDRSRVVSKDIGDTEKNIDRVFIGSTLLYCRLRLAFHGVPRSLADTANEYRPLGAVIKPRKRNPIGRRTADWRHCRAGIRSDLSEGVKAIGGNRCDEKQTPNLDHVIPPFTFRG